LIKWSTGTKVVKFTQMQIHSLAYIHITWQIVTPIFLWSLNEEESPLEHFRSILSTSFF
jgi:hypothetical protein